MTSRKPRVSRDCAECGVEMLLMPCRLGQKYCSKPCAILAQTERLKIVNHERALAKRELKPGHIQAHDRSWFLVSEIDREFLEQFPWRAARKRDRFYAERKVGNSTEVMARVVMERMLGRELEKGELVDHVDRNPRNNTRSNLRLADCVTNQQNHGLSRRNTSGYKGVSPSGRPKRPWEVRIRAFNSQAFSVGRFENKEEAAWMRDQWALALHGEFAYLNFEYIEVPSQMVTR